MLYQDDNVLRINRQKKVEIQDANGSHSANDSDIDCWLVGLWDFWLHQKIKPLRHRSPVKGRSPVNVRSPVKVENSCLAQPKVESLLHRRTTEVRLDADNDHHLTLSVQISNKRRIEDDENISQKRQRVQPMDATFDETLTLWIMHGKITIEQLKYWIATRKRDNVI